jgi:hypothetical protein
METIIECHYDLLCIAVPSTALSVSIEPTGNPVAGTMYDILCSATILEGILSTPIFTWLDSNNSRVMDGGDITVGPPTATSLPLEFRILRGSHGGRYTCQVRLFSLALQAPLTATTSIDISIQRKDCKKYTLAIITM